MGQPIGGNAPEVRVMWGSHNVWKPGQEHDGPVHAHTIWIMLYGHAQVGDGSEVWDVHPGHVFLWPCDKHRHILSTSDSAWLSVGIAATPNGQGDLLRLLPLPALHRMEADEHALLYSWFTQIIDLREAQSLSLLTALPNHPDPAQILGVRRDIVSQHPHQMWMNRVVIERASFYDMVENGLGHAIVAWCWKMWGTGDLQHALLHQSPQWLQNTLKRIRENPAVSVHDLAQAAGFSPAHFRRLFHQEVGQSPHDFLQHQRLELAKKLLETTNLSIPTIAAQSGFSSIPHFTQWWKSICGTPPHQYRLALKKGDGKNF